MRRRGRTDTEHRAIVEALRAAGCTVQSLADVGEGCPDLMASIRGVNMLFEIKGPHTPWKPAQHSWHARWRGTVFVVATVDEALRAVRLIGRG
jgi:hypothetical protein